MIPPNAETVDADLLLAIVRHHELTGLSPSYVEMRRITGHHNQWIHKRLHALRDAGFLAWSQHAHGTMHPLVTEVPLRRTRESETA